MRPASSEFGLRAGEGGEHIQRDGKQLQRQEDDDQVGGLRHEHHAGDAEEQQGVILAALEAHALEVAIGQRHAEAGR